MQPRTKGQGELADAGQRRNTVSAERQGWKQNHPVPAEFTHKIIIQIWIDWPYEIMRFLLLEVLKAAHGLIRAFKHKMTFNSLSKG